MRAFRGILYGVALSVPLWALILGTAYWLVLR
jgi:hypothetical protein